MPCTEIPAGITLADQAVAASIQEDGASWQGRLPAAPAPTIGTGSHPFSLAAASRHTLGAPAPHRRRWAAIVAAAVAAAGCHRPAPTPDVYRHFVEKALAKPPKTLPLLLDRLAPRESVTKRSSVYEAAHPAIGVDALRLETVLAQGRERVRAVTVVAGPNAKPVLIPVALKERGLLPERAAMPVRAQKPASLATAEDLAAILGVLEGGPTNILAVCLALDAKCAPAVPAPSENGGPAWRCATVERWSGRVGLFRAGRACVAREPNGKTVAAVDLEPVGDLPPLALRGYALLRHRAITATLDAEDLLAKEGAAYRASVRYGLDSGDTGHGPRPVRRIVAASALLCGQGGAVAGCVPAPAAAETLRVAKAEPQTAAKAR